MLFKDILGLSHIKNHLALSADAGRIPHAQLFVGPEGSGTLPMALAYTQYIVCGNKNGENSEGAENCNLKFDSFSHPDVHFAFPVANSDKIKSHAVSNHYMQEWRQFISEQPYGNLFDWYRLIDIEKKQGQIGVDEALDIVKKLSLKSYEGGYKVMLIWMAERMNNAAANKDLLHEDSEDLVFEKWFIQWVRTAFKAKGNKGAIRELILWSEELAKTGREVQKKFLHYCIMVMRQAMLINYGAEALAYMKINDAGFQLKKFAPFIHENNIIIITEELEKAIYHIERNGNAKIVFTDLSIKLTRLLHKKPNSLKA